MVESPYRTTLYSLLESENLHKSINRDNKPISKTECEIQRDSLENYDYFSFASKYQTKAVDA